MEIETTRDDGSVVVVLKGSLTAGDAERRFTELYESLIADGVTAMTIDFSDVGIVDSSGLGALVRCHNACAAEGGGVRLCGLNPQQRGLLELTRLTDLMEIVDS